MRLDVKIPKSTEVDEMIEKNDLEEMDYDSRWGAYRLRLNKGDIKKHHDLLKDLLKRAESNY